MPQNQILRSLPSDAHAFIAEFCTSVELAQQAVIYAPGAPVDFVYFLESGMVSLLTNGTDGRAIKTGVVGREGLLGSTVVLGAPETDGQAVVQVGGWALCMPAPQFLQAYRRFPILTGLVNQHVGLLLFQARQNALCHALHSIESRFCRWILQSSDRLDSNVLELTQESCSQILGVQRTSVSMIAHALQLAGSIRTRRGKIEILNRESLQRTACACYEKVKRRFDSVYLKAA
jgi:CRP-like cAMP-binding protein